MFDFKTFLTDHWSDPATLHVFLEKRGIKTWSAQAVYKWWVRATVPAEGFAILASLLEINQGAPVSLAKYVRGS